MIYPIYLKESTAKWLISKHFANELNDATRFIYGEVQYEFSGEVLENGDVNLRVWHRFDNGFAMGGGTLLAKTFRPFDDDHLMLLKQKKMIELATEVFDRRRSEEEMKQIMMIAKEMFGDDFKVQEE